MSDLLESLLTPGRRVQARAADQLLRRAADRVTPPTVVGRADQIIAEGNAKRVAYGPAKPYADDAMVYGAQIAHLHDHVKALCAALECFEANVSEGLDKMDVETSKGTATVGYTYAPEVPDRITSARTLELTGDPGHPGSAAKVDVQEVWINGVDFRTWVPAADLARITNYVLERRNAQAHAEKERDAALADEWSAT